MLLQERFIRSHKSKKTTTALLNNDTFGFAHEKLILSISPCCVLLWLVQSQLLSAACYLQ